MQKDLDGCLPPPCGQSMSLPHWWPPILTKAFKLAPSSKRIVTLLHSKPTARVKLPIGRMARTFCASRGRKSSALNVRSENGPVFMRLIEKTFGKDLTTRTWDTLGKVVKAGGS